MELKMEMVNVTPELAKRWWDNRFDKQRPLNMSNARKYAKDMTDGNWRLDSDGIIVLNKRGQLMNGQHRSMAVILADTTVPMFVMTGAEDEAYDVMDSGKARTVADVLNGVKNAKVCGAIAKKALSVKLGDGIISSTHNGGGRKSKVITKKNIIDYFRENEDRIAKAAQYVASMKYAIGRTSSYGIGLPIYLYSFINNDVVEYVMEDVKKPAPDDERVAAFKTSCMTAIIKDTFDGQRQFAMMMRLFEQVENDEPPLAKYTSTDRILKRWDDRIKQGIEGFNA